MTKKREVHEVRKDLLLAPPERQAQLEDMFQTLAAIGIAARHEELKKRQYLTQIPLTIFSGFLGAGKTTVLNELLAGDHGLRLAVIVNDFGSVNIDAALIRADNDGIISLENGCVCCSSSGQLTDTLDLLAGRHPPPDAIVLESSGIADPRNTARLALVNRGIQLDAVVTIVDSETLLQNIERSDFGHLVRRQLESADIVILNKTDLVSAEQLMTVRNWAHAHAPEARLAESERGKVAAEVLLGVGASHRPEAGDRDKVSDHVHAAFDTWTFATDKPVDQKALIELIRDLPKPILRAKGILNTTDDSEHQVILQMVSGRVSFQRGEPWGQQLPSTRLVLIGTRGSIESDALDRRFDHAIAT